jgi:hypothetical protein
VKSAFQNLKGNTKNFTVTTNSNESAKAITYRDGPGSESRSFSGDMPWVGDDWNDLITSIQVPDGYKLIILQDADFKGYAMEISGFWSAANLPDWDNRISSMRLVKQ